MLKLTGSLLIFSASILAWYKRSAGRRQQQRAERELLLFLREMREVIRQRHTPLPALFQELSGRWCPEVEGFVQAVTIYLRHGSSFSEAWRRAAAALPLSEENIEIFTALGEDINGDEDKAYKEISFTYTQLEERLKEAAQSVREKEKQLSTLWFSAAALLVILLL